MQLLSKGGFCTMNSHFIDLRLYDDGTCLVTESDKEGSVPDFKRSYVGKSMSVGWRIFRDMVIKRK